MDILGDGLLFTDQLLIQQCVLLEELAHLAFGDLFENGLGLACVLRILLHRLDGDLALMRDYVGRAIGHVDRDGSHRRSLHGYCMGHLLRNDLVEAQNRTQLLVEVNV